MAKGTTPKKKATKAKTEKEAIDFDKLHKSQIALYNENLKSIDPTKPEGKTIHALTCSFCFGHVPEVVKDLLFTQFLNSHGKTTK
jgi:hypothetical protein